MVKSGIKTIELLAPARNADTAIAAITCGADAVYIGAGSHGARAAAGYSVGAIARVVDFAHRFNARVYVTLNTIIYDSEIVEVERLVSQLYEAGVDALIVQDMALLRMNIPPISLHASTQCDTRSVSKALFLQQVGFSQIVLARELSLKEIDEIYQVVDVPLEAFVHGALCVSYSGDCQASSVAMERSANRGECAQMCRLPYTLTDADGDVIIENKHLLSLRDMNRSADIAAMIEAGVSSFKIEGRLKDISYVKNTVAYYRRAIDAVISANPLKYRRASSGCSCYNFVPALEKSFNRGFTDYFLKGKNSSIASIDTPKSIGERIGKVKSACGKSIAAQLDVPLNNGDGLGYFDEKGEFTGFRLNKAEGNMLFPAGTVVIKPGTVLYRNKDKGWDDLLLADGVSRSIGVAMSLSLSEGKIIFNAVDERGNEAELSLDVELQQAKIPQQQARQRVLTKTGNTIYNVTEIVDELGDYFIPASILAEARRSILDVLDAEQVKNYRRDMRREENASAILPQGERLSYHDNVANRLAEEFYRSHGAKIIERAIELDKGKRQRELTVMTTRYCLRREMGRCLKTPQGRDWKAPMYITSTGNRFRLDFDCKECRMRVVWTNGDK